MAHVEFRRNVTNEVLCVGVGRVEVAHGMLGKECVAIGNVLGMAGCGCLPVGSSGHNEGVESVYIKISLGSQSDKAKHEDCPTKQHLFRK